MTKQLAKNMPEMFLRYEMSIPANLGEKCFDGACIAAAKVLAGCYEDGYIQAYANPDTLLRVVREKGDERPGNNVYLHLIRRGFLHDKTRYLTGKDQQAGDLVRKGD